MAQYFEVLSQNDGSEDQTPHQFFNGNLENERPQVRYILAEDSAQFQTPQVGNYKTTWVEIPII